MATSSLIDRSYYGSPMRSAASHYDTTPERHVDGLPDATFSTLRFSIFEGLDPHPNVDARAVVPPALNFGIDGLTRHPDAPKPFSIADILDAARSRSPSPQLSPPSSHASELAMALAERSRALAPQPPCDPFVSEEDYEEVGYEGGHDAWRGYGQDAYQTSSGMNVDGYYSQESSVSSRTSRFLNSSGFAPTAGPRKSSFINHSSSLSSTSSTSSRKSRFITPSRRQPQEDIVAPVMTTSSTISQPSTLSNSDSIVSLPPPPSLILPTSDFLINAIFEDVESDPELEESSHDGGSSTSSSTLSSPPSSNFAASLSFTTPFKPSPLPSAASAAFSSIYSHIDRSFENIKGAGDSSPSPFASSPLAISLKNAVDEAFEDIRTYMSHSVSTMTSRFSQVSSAPGSMFGGGILGIDIRPQSHSPGPISRILMDFFASQEQQGLH